MGRGVAVGNGGFDGGPLFGGGAADKNVVEFDVSVAVPLRVVGNSLGTPSSGDSVRANALAVVIVSKLGGSQFAIPLAAGESPSELVAVVLVFSGVVHSGEGFKDTMCE